MSLKDTKTGTSYAEMLKIVSQRRRLRHYLFNDYVAWLRYTLLKQGRKKIGVKKFLGLRDVYYFDPF